MAFIKSSLKREIHNDKCLSQETRKGSGKQSNLIPLGTRKIKTNESQSQ